MTRRVPETGGGYGGGFDGGLARTTCGLVAGTRVASNMGWRAVEALAAGDSVLTFDNGMQQVTEVRRCVMWTDAPDTAPGLWPVIVPAGALDNRVPLTLLADQGVVVECDAASDLYGDPFAVIPAHVLTGVRGIHRAAPQERIELVVLCFAEDQVVYAEGGTLIHCPQSTAAIDVLMQGASARYDMLSENEAAFLAECLIAEDQLSTYGGNRPASSRPC